VYSPQCTSHSTRLLYLRNSGENDDFHAPLRMYTVPPCDYKRRGGLPLRRTLATIATWVGRLSRHTPLRAHALRHRYSPRSTPLLAGTWELPSLSRLACTPYYKHSRCRIIQCPRTPLCWTYGPVAGTRINPCVTVLPLVSTFGMRKHAAFTSRDPDPPGQDADNLQPKTRK
jgi:hypothetical protein